MKSPAILMFATILALFPLHAGAQDAAVVAATRTVLEGPLNQLKIRETERRQALQVHPKISGEPIAASGPEAEAQRQKSAAVRQTALECHAAVQELILAAFRKTRDFAVVKETTGDVLDWRELPHGFGFRDRLDALQDDPALSDEEWAADRNGIRVLYRVFPLRGSACLYLCDNSFRGGQKNSARMRGSCYTILSTPRGAELAEVCSTGSLSLESGWYGDDSALYFLGGVDAGDSLPWLFFIGDTKGMGRYLDYLAYRYDDGQRKWDYAIATAEGTYAGVAGFKYNDEKAVLTLAFLPDPDAPKGDPAAESRARDIDLRAMAAEAQAYLAEKWPQYEEALRRWRDDPRENVPEPQMPLYTP